MIELLNRLFSDMRAIDYLTLISAIVAVIVSILSLMESKRRLILSAITSNRIIWISELREAMQEFLKEYLAMSDDKNSLRVSRVKIELYISGSKMYAAFSNQLEKCSIDPFSEEDYKKFIENAQDVLNSTWRRMKREAGISFSFDNRLAQKMEKEMANRVRLRTYRHRNKLE